MAEEYKPTPEEIADAEGMMNKEEKSFSRIREDLTKKSDEDLIYALQDAFNFSGTGGERDMRYLIESGHSRSEINAMEKYTNAVIDEVLRRLKNNK